MGDAYVASFAGILVGYFALWTIALRWGGKWAGSPRATYRRSLAILAATACMSVAGLVAANYVAADVSDLVAVGALLIQLLIGWLLIARLFELKWTRAILAWLPTLLATAVFLLAALFVLRPFVFEAYSVPTNAMAPTILGDHFSAPCPRCGSPAYGLPTLSGFPSQKVLMICSRELKTCEVDRPPVRVDSGDMIVVNKLLAPQRWDLVVFKYPKDPSTIYTKRLVGLPGEQVVIREGGVWVDGVRLEMPKSLTGLEYFDVLPLALPLNGTSDRPAQLGADEYFVLGDFSKQSSDSRVWNRGAPGHPSYAVPASHLGGVVTHIYWPIARWRAFR